MALFSEPRGAPSFAARRQHYGALVKRWFSDFTVSALQSVLLRPAQRGDVVECYRTVLGREPESWNAIEQYIARRPLVRDVISDFSKSGELRSRLLRSNLALHRAREPHYLARTLHGMRSVQAYFGSYSFLIDTLSPSALNTLIEGHAPLHVHQFGRVDYRIVMTATHEHHDEGELQVQFCKNGVVLYVMGITVVPGDTLGMGEDHVLLISRMQGVGGTFLELSRATKDYGDIHPKAVLIAAIKGFAMAVGIDVIAGVSAKNQLAFRPARADDFIRNYDKFFEDTGAERWSEDFFIIQTRGDQKLIMHGDRSHRRRAERKRHFKAEITANAAKEAAGWLNVT
jgi:uncharacterized protein VirK/YbjX